MAATAARRWPIDVTQSGPAGTTTYVYWINNYYKDIQISGIRDREILLPKLLTHRAYQSEAQRYAGPTLEKSGRHTVTLDYRTVNTPPALRPNCSGAFSKYARAPGHRNVPGVTERTK